METPKFKTGDIVVVISGGMVKEAEILGIINVDLNIIDEAVKGNSPPWFNNAIYPHCAGEMNGVTYITTRGYFAEKKVFESREALCDHIRNATVEYID